MNLLSFILSIFGIIVGAVGIFISIWCWKHAYSEVKEYNKLARSLYELDYKDPEFLRKFHTTAEKMYVIRKEMTLIEIKNNNEKAPEGYITKNEFVSSLLETANKALKYFDSYPKEKANFDKEIEKL